MIRDETASFGKPGTRRSDAAALLFLTPSSFLSALTVEHCSIDKCRRYFLIGRFRCRAEVLAVSRAR